MADQIKVFWLEPNGMERRWLRRFSMAGDCSQPPDADYRTFCSAMTFLCDCPKDELLWAEFPQDDARWPTQCERCSKAFGTYDAFQHFNHAIYVRPDTGEVMTLREAPPGACWNAQWFVGRELHEARTGSGYNTGPDGRCLIVRLPDGHDWMIDSRCSNCTLPNDKDHYCWVRHGRPEDGTLHVDKVGNTCSAGAGSIQTNKWHGFLRQGYLCT